MKISRNFNDMEYEFQLTPDELEVAYRMRLREYQSEDAAKTYWRVLRRRRY